jgi:hypothetical protein
MNDKYFTNTITEDGRLLKKMGGRSEAGTGSRPNAQLRYCEIV